MTNNRLGYPQTVMPLYASDNDFQSSLNVLPPFPVIGKGAPEVGTLKPVANTMVSRSC